MTKVKRSKWNFSILHNGEQGVSNLFAIFAIAAIIAIPVIHLIFNVQILACIIISFVLFCTIWLIVAIILGCTGSFNKTNN